MSTATTTREQHALMALRILLGGLVAAHGWARWLSDAVTPFGEWLEGQGIPMGLIVASGITALEILGTPFFVWGKGVFYLSIVYAVLYAAGLIMVHASEGWFVVGLGRNGMEYSVLLIISFLCIAYQHLPARYASPAASSSAVGELQNPD